MISDFHNNPGNNALIFKKKKSGIFIRLLSPSVSNSVWV